MRQAQETKVKEKTDHTFSFTARILLAFVSVAVITVLLTGLLLLARGFWFSFNDGLSSKEATLVSFVIALVCACVVAAVIAYVFARVWLVPINKVSKTAAAIREGDYSARTNLSGDDEVSRLGETFDQMAAVIEKDREFEHKITTDIAHELRTPLMAIQANVEAMVDGVVPTDAEHLEIVDKEVMRLGRLVESLIRLSRLESNTTPIEMTQVSINQLVENIVKVHSTIIEELGLELHYFCVPDTYVLGNADMLNQAVVNLLSNAIRYTPSGGEIHIEVVRNAQAVSISVRDTGIGLTPEEKELVFSRFWRSNEAAKSEQKGLGIGLSIVKEIVNKHSGWVQVEGEKGKGSCFTIHLPAYKHTSAKTPIETWRLNLEADQTSKKEDDE